MPTLAGTLVTDILDRVRDPNAQMVATDNPPTTTTGTAFVVAMLSLGQQYAARATRFPTATFTLATGATAVYDMTLVGPADWMGRMLGVTIASGGTEIDGPVDYRALGRANRSWFTAVGTPLSWSPIGLTLLAIYPSPGASINVTLTYLPLLPTIPNTGTNMKIPDPFVEQAAEIAELLCRIKTRQLTDFDNRLKDITDALKIVDHLVDTGGKAL